MWQPCGPSRESHRFLCQLGQELDTTFTAQEESRLACLHTRRGLTPLWKLHRNPEIHVSTGEKSYVLTSKVTEAIGPCADWRGIPRGPSQLAWRLDFPEETWSGTWRLSRNSRGTPSFLPQLEKNQEILPSTQDEALFSCSILREIPPSLLSLESVFNTLDAIQAVSLHPLLQSWVTPRVSWHNSRRAPFFPPHLDMRVCLEPAEEIPTMTKVMRTSPYR